MTEDLVYIVHGSNAHTWWRRLANGGYPWWRRWSLFSCELRRAFGRDCELREFRWSGDNKHQARLDAGADLAQRIEKFGGKRRIHIVGHSHGGNVALAAVNGLPPNRIDNLVLLANPNMVVAGEWLYWGNALERVPHIWNLYSPEDGVQCSLVKKFHGLSSGQGRSLEVRHTYEGPGREGVHNASIHWNSKHAAHRAMHSASVGAVAGQLLRGRALSEAMAAAGLSAADSNTVTDRGGRPGIFKTQELINLRGNPRPFELGGSLSDIGILFIHGFTASPAEMRPMAKYLNLRSGWRCKGITLPGHGTRIEDMQHARGEDWVVSVQTAYDDLARDCRHVFLAGVSLGAALCVHVALRRRADAKLRGLILMAPAFGVSLKRTIGVYLLRPVRNLRPKPTRAADYFLDNRLYSYLHTPLNLAADVLRLGREAVARLSELKEVPVLLFAGDLESTVSLEKIHAVARNNPWVRFVRLPKSRHILTVEPDREMMFEASAEFVEECVRKS